MEDTQPNLSCPKTLGKYELREEPGRAAWRPSTSDMTHLRTQVLQSRLQTLTLSKTARKGAQSRKLFFNEAKVAGMLKHSNIVEVRDAGVKDDACFILIEFIGGNRTLRDHTRPGTLLSPEKVVRIISKCAKALDHAHRAGVVHHDIKPRNILLTQDGDVKTGDFGTAQITRLDPTDTKVDGYLGSPLYMAPEQIGMGEVTNQSDIWSLCVVMYELLTGRHPFGANCLPSIIHLTTTQSYTPIHELRARAPKILAHVVDRMLIKDAAHRYETCLDVAGVLNLVFSQLNLSEKELSDRDQFNHIKGLTFFRNFTMSEIWEVVNANIWKDFYEGDEIIAEGEMDNSFYIIVTGRVAVNRGSAVMDTLNPGDCFDEMGFISNQKRAASILAMEDVSVVKVRTSLSCQSAHSNRSVAARRMATHLAIGMPRRLEPFESTLLHHTTTSDSHPAATICAVQ
jgi:serine/threonine protein kinase